MSDRIIVDRIAVFAHHGVLPEEQKTGQRFYVSLDCELDLRDAASRDDIGASVNYAELAGRAAAIAGSRRFFLIEALAQAIAEDALAAFARIEAITVRVDKPSAPVPHLLEGIAVVITRRRG
ncbi:dihydroneopterin aldolase [Enterovirga rhinocerotis]|uniref:7,8-dihydroneopterin aldolase n=1 Tax=Enterovirga rhinocerotis TaxID=1339210 RepID=A0A4R7C6B9_9HYPH|nr:dihydroneopterin aldolase [Enterovirga rhinocerotis]TDR93663.1 dihydroneopterin aldolase [Enterovirga rhinocerotis]